MFARKLAKDVVGSASRSWRSQIQRGYTVVAGTNNVNYEEPDVEHLNKLKDAINNMAVLGIGTVESIGAAHEISRAVNEGTKMHADIINAGIRSLDDSLAYAVEKKISITTKDKGHKSNQDLCRMMIETKTKLLLLRPDIMFDPAKEKKLDELRNHGQKKEDPSILR